ncbi:ABC transporter permease subunit [Corynebacterium diphtheriae]|uniref:ABC transporter permease subunit n=1 Tax=Corynebacterium diphtheriae TaxID=1717 RepID=UPI001E63DE46|nr:ABC transporter permease subunit [Corynebacterium diphtheriae]UFX14225.1 ABC transporter permease subunit [Corynebacterium diphtheriae]
MTWFGDLLSYLTTAAHWWGSQGFLARLLEHVGISLAAVAIAALLALPAGVLIGHTGRGAGLVGGVSGAARALPTLGLLTIFGLAFGIGLTAPMLALIILAIPSLLAGAYSGVAAVDRATIDAAYAMGFTHRQVISSIELPLSAAVLVIALALLFDALLGGAQKLISQRTRTATPAP